MKIVTAGQAYLDIDSYAGCIAYAELLQKQGSRAQAVSAAAFNQSIPQEVRDWNAPLVTTYTPSDDDTFSLVDISDPKAFASFVDPERIETIIDHHPGLETYWRERLGDQAYIERVGAACTQVYKRWAQAGLLDKMSETSARLLVCGILDNTLNFGASITNQRDKIAYAKLLTRANLPDDWPAHYFAACEASIMADPAGALKNDTKRITYKTFSEEIRAGQLAVWDGAALLKSSKAIIESAMADIEPHWFVNIISIGEGKSYFVCDSPAVQVWLGELLSVTFTEGQAVADRMWLRKEIRKEDLDTPEL